MKEIKRFTLVLKRSSDGLNDSIPNLRALMNKMEVLASSFADDPGVTLVHIQIIGDVLPQLPKYMCRAGEVQRCERAVRDGLSDHFRWGAGNELDDAWGNTGFGEYLMDDVVRVCRGR